MNLDVGQALGYVFKDPNWIQKVAIGGLLLFIPVIGWLIVAGYFARIVQAAYAAGDTALPEWNDFGGDLLRGVQLALASLAWVVPLVAIILALTLLLVFTGTLDERLGALAVSGLVLFYLLMLIASVGLSFLLPLVIGRVAVTGRVAAGLDVGAVLGEARAHPLPLLIVFLVELGIRSVAQFGIVLCVVGVVFPMFWAYAVSGHLYGQLRRVADGPGGAPPVI